MPTLVVPRNYADNEALTQSELDDVVDALETAANTTKWGGDNLQDASIEANHLDAGAVTTTSLASNAVTSAKLSSSSTVDVNRAVGTDHIKDASVTSAKIAAAGLATAALADGSVTTVKLADANVTTAKLADHAVTQVKLGAKNIVFSATCGPSAGMSGILADVPNLSVPITTTGRPVVITLVSDGDTSFSSRIDVGSSSSFLVCRNGSVIGISEHSISGGGNVPGSVVWMVDSPAAGTYTYKIQYQGASAFFRRLKLCVFEM